MADKKISQLTALSAANVASATDVLAIVDTSATETKKITAKDLIDGALNGGTANGVLYLNGSKVATSGSALTFDGTDLGVGTTTPRGNLDVSSGGTGTSVTKSIHLGYSAADFYGFRVANTNTAGSLYAGTFLIQRGTGSAWSDDLVINDSGNVGIGTASPGVKLDVAGEIRSIVSGGTPAVYLNNGSTQHSIQNNSGAFTFYNSGTERMRLDTSGNLGLGVTPSAWGTDYKAFQIGGSATASLSYKNFVTSLGINFYSTNSQDIALVNGSAAKYELNGSGQHVWKTASTTSGNAITFTQAMTLDASGNLLVGATSLAFAEKFQMYGNYAVFNNASYTGFIGQGSALGTATASDFALRSSNALAFLTGGATERARITSGGKFLVGTTSNAFDGNLLVYQATAANDTISIWNAATSGDNQFIEFYTEGDGTGRGSIDYNRAGGLVRYNTTSDYRAKDVYGLLDDSGETIDALKVYRGKMHGATMERPMLIAHEAQAVTPYAVTGEKDAVNENGDPVYQQMDTSSLVPLLIAEIQSLRTRVAALESA